MPLTLKQKTLSGLFIAFLSTRILVAICRLSATISDAIIFKTKDLKLSGFFIAFLKSTWNGERFQKKGESSSLSISEIIDSKRGGYLSAWKDLLQNSFR